MATFKEQYEIAYKACKVMFPIGVIFFELLGLILLITLFDTGYGLPIGLPMMLFGVILAVAFNFALKYMRKQIAEFEKQEKQNK